MSGDKFEDDFYDSSAYTADISTKMRIPEHLNAVGSLRNGENNHKEFGKANSALYDMQVPDRWENIFRDFKIFVFLAELWSLGRMIIFILNPLRERFS